MRDLFVYLCLDFFRGGKSICFNRRIEMSRVGGSRESFVLVGRKRDFKYVF